MRFTFANNALAAAFCAAVMANNKQDIDGDNLDTCTLSGTKDKTTIEIDSEDGGLYLNGPDYIHEKEVISTLAQLEQAIGNALAIKPGDDDDAGNTSPVLFRLNEGDDDSPLSDYNIRIRADGTIRVGCKNFTRKGAEQVIAAAKKVVAGQKFERFETNGGGDGALVHSVRISDYSDDQIVIGGEPALAKDILLLGKIRERALAKAKPLRVKQAAPFRLFPAPKAKAKKAVKRKSKK